MSFGPGNFLCGCVPEEKEHYKTVRKDHRGALCPEHGEPMYGYLSPVKATPSGRDTTDWGKMGTADTVRLVPDPEIKDIRDTRTPMEAYAERQKEKALTRNGHVEK